LEACTALLPLEVAEPVAQQEEVVAAAPGARQAVAVTAARSGVRQQERSVD